MGILDVYEFSDELAEVTGKSKGTRADAIKGIWKYIRDNDLKEEGGPIEPDAALAKVMGKGKKKNTDVMKAIGKHLL